MSTGQGPQRPPWWRVASKAIAALAAVVGAGAPTLLLITADDRVTLSEATLLVTVLAAAVPAVVYLAPANARRPPQVPRAPDVEAQGWRAPS